MWDEPFEVYEYQCCCCGRWVRMEHLTPDSTGAMWCDTCMNWVQSYTEQKEEEVWQTSM